MEDLLESRAKAKARVEPKRGQKRETRGSAPIGGGSSSSADAVVFPSTSVSMSSVGIQPSSSGTVGSLCCNESKAKDFETLIDLVLTSNEFSGKPSRESVQGLVKTCREMCAVDFAEVYSPALFN